MSVRGALKEIARPIQVYVLRPASGHAAPVPSVAPLEKRIITQRSRLVACLNDLKKRHS
jgi:hypothetical protein